MNQITISEATIDGALKAVNAHRKQNKNKWIETIVKFRGETTSIKSFNTSIQILRKNGLDYGSTWDASVAAFTEKVKECLEK